MKVYISADHGGFSLKGELKKYLEVSGQDVEDLGADRLDPDDDYPNLVFPVADNVSRNEGSRGIVIGRSGNGEAIAANKIKGIRAAICWNEEVARKAREHNNANVLSLGADYISNEDAKKIAKAFLETSFSEEERHKRRLQKISEHE